MSGSFVGAAREPGEPTHGTRNLPETLWWTWTSPTNTGLAINRVRLFADSVSLSANLAVYRGQAVISLTNVPSTSITNGMTRVLDFDAVARETYQIALAGRQHEPSGNVVYPDYGNYRLRIAARGGSIFLRI